MTGIGRGFAALGLVMVAWTAAGPAARADHESGSRPSLTTWKAEAMGYGLAVSAWMARMPARERFAMFERMNDYARALLSGEAAPPFAELTGSEWVGLDEQGANELKLALLDAQLLDKAPPAGLEGMRHRDLEAAIEAFEGEAFAGACRDGRVVEGGALGNPALERLLIKRGRIAVPPDARLARATIEMMQYCWRYYWRHEEPFASGLVEELETARTQQVAAAEAGGDPRRIEETAATYDRAIAEARGRPFWEESWFGLGLLGLGLLAVAGTLGLRWRRDRRGFREEV